MECVFTDMTIQDFGVVKVSHMFVYRKVTENKRSIVSEASLTQNPTFHNWSKIGLETAYANKCISMYTSEPKKNNNIYFVKKKLKKTLICTILVLLYYFYIFHS